MTSRTSTTGWVRVAGGAPTLLVPLGTPAARRVEDLNDIELPDHEDYDTIAGLVLQVLGRVPVRGDVAEVPVPTAPTPTSPNASAWPSHCRTHGRAAHRPAVPAAPRGADDTDAEAGPR